MLFELNRYWYTGVSHPSYPNKIVPISGAYTTFKEALASKNASCVWVEKNVKDGLHIAEWGTWYTFASPTYLLARLRL